jgi:hypothetical protein
VATCAIPIPSAIVKKANRNTVNEYEKYIPVIPIKLKIIPIKYTDLYPNISIRLPVVIVAINFEITLRATAIPIISSPTFNSFEMIGISGPIRYAAEPIIRTQKNENTRMFLL